MIQTFNSYHLGDNLVHLSFLRRLAKKYPEKSFSHYAAPQHRPQLVSVIEDLPNIVLSDECDGSAINAWRGAGNFWHLHAKRNDFVEFHVDWFHHLAEQMGLESPIHGAEDLMFDYPALAPAPGTEHFEHPQFDVLLINSIPHSGQFRGFNTHDFATLAKTLTDQGKTVITTFPTGVCESTHDGTTGLPVTAIGRLSTSAKAIVGVVTGPTWTCYNVWNKGKKFIQLLDEERVNIMPNTEHVHSCGEALAKL